MAEGAAVVGGLWAAEEVVSTGVQAGVAGYMLTKPTMPLKATYTRIGTAKDDATKRSLARSHHTLTVIGNKGYVFGGRTEGGSVASNDIHAVTLVASGEPESDYSLVPALAENELGNVPLPRIGHAACAFDDSVAIFGGRGENSGTVDQTAIIWLYHPEHKHWTSLSCADSHDAPSARHDANIFSHEHSLIVFGGTDSSGNSLSDVWRFYPDSKTWTMLPAAPVSTSNAALTNGELYLISGQDPMSSQVHVLNIPSTDQDAEWTSFTFPTNPMAPGPRLRHGSGLLPVTTGYGRNYLVYFLGVREDVADEVSPSDEKAKASQWSDMWTLQLPSSNLEVQAKMSIGEAIKPAKIKDKIRNWVGADTGKHAWAEVEVQVPSDTLDPEGKLHPGPRAFFGCDTLEDGKSVAFWGGEVASGQCIGDGWIVRLE